MPAGAMRHRTPSSASRIDLFIGGVGLVDQKPQNSEGNAA
jgi:hypothetical protein